MELIYKLMPPINVQQNLIADQYCVNSLQILNISEIGLSVGHSSSLMEDNVARGGK